MCIDLVNVFVGFEIDDMCFVIESFDSGVGIGVSEIEVLEVGEI